MSYSLYNMISSIKNGQKSKKNSILIEKTKFCELVLKVLWDEGYILGYSNLTHLSHKLEVYLKYDSSGKPAIKKITAISKPGRRVYTSVKQMWKLESSQSFVIFSTNKGIRTLSDCKKCMTGGEPLFTIQ